MVMHGVDSRRQHDRHTSHILLPAVDYKRGGVRWGGNAPAVDGAEAACVGEVGKYSPPPELFLRKLEILPHQPPFPGMARTGALPVLPALLQGSRLWVRRPWEP